MSVINFRPADLARIRFAISPTWETVASWGVQRRPQRSPHHRSWVPTAKRAAARPSFAEHARLLDALVPLAGWIPDFLSPSPATVTPAFDDELGVLESLPPVVVHDDILATEVKRPLTALARRVADDPVTWMPALVEALRAWHRVAIEPHWSRMATVLEADIAYRATTMAAHGPGWMFESVHQELRWRDDHLLLEDGEQLDARLGGRGMALIPSVFFAPGPALTVRPESPPLLVYPARASGAVWETRRTPAPDTALAALLGASRSRILMLLDAPANTTQVAARLELGTPTVSEHLQVLHAAGLITRHRQGREVFYVLSDLGRRLLPSR